MSDWIICAGSVQTKALELYLKSCSSSASIAKEANPWLVRNKLRLEPSRWNVAVSEGLKELDAINVAATYALESCASDVLLVVNDASGSMRSRAKRAGISRVLSFDETTELN